MHPFIKKTTASNKSKLNTCSAWEVVSSYTLHNSFLRDQYGPAKKAQFVVNHVAQVVLDWN